MTRLVVISMTVVAVLLVSGGLAVADAAASPDVFVDVWGAAKTSGPFAAMIALLFLWLSRQDLREEREERRKLQEQYNELQERVIDGLNTAAVAVTSVSASTDSLRASLTSAIEAMRRDRS